MNKRIMAFKISVGMLFVSLLSMPVMAQLAEGATPMNYGESINFLSHATAQGVLSFVCVVFLGTSLYLGKKLLDDKERLMKMVGSKSESEAKHAEAIVRFSHSMNHLAGVIKGCRGNNWEEPKTEA